MPMKPYTVNQAVFRQPQQHSFDNFIDGYRKHQQIVADLASSIQLWQFPHIEPNHQILVILLLSKAL